MTILKGNDTSELASEDCVAVSLTLGIFKYFNIMEINKIH